MAIKENSFVEVSYTGKTKEGLVFDTSSADIAKAAKVFNPKQKYEPARVCVGQGQILPGLDESLVDRKAGEKYTIEISPEKGFGKRDVKNVELVPMSTFNEHKVKPFTGLQVDFDGKIGVVMKISGGRVMVNFNHPLSGKDLIYDVEILREITDSKEQLESFLGNVLQLKPEFVKVSVDSAAKKANIEMPFQLPEQFVDALSEKLGIIIDGLDTVEFSVKVPEGMEGKIPGHHHHEHGPNCSHG